MTLNKKLLRVLVLIASLAVSSLTFAEEIEDFVSNETTTQDVLAPDYPFKNMGIYLEGDIGGLHADWKHSIRRRTAQATGNSGGGFTAGGAIGYQAVHYFGVEIGAFYVPPLTYVQNNVEYRMRSFFAYIAGKVMIPTCRFIPNSNLFIKLGMAYRHSKTDEFLLSRFNDSNDWRPMIGVGGQYYFNPNWYLTFQWMLIPSGSSIDSNNAVLFKRSPIYQVFTAGLGYRFVF